MDWSKSSGTPSAWAGAALQRPTRFSWEREQGAGQLLAWIVPRSDPPVYPEATPSAALRERRWAIVLSVHNVGWRIGSTTRVTALCASHVQRKAEQAEEELLPVRHRGDSSRGRARPGPRASRVHSNKGHIFMNLQTFLSPSTRS